MEIRARFEYFGDLRGGITLSINGDSRIETLDNLVFLNTWGAFSDIDGFDPDNQEIINAVEAAAIEGLSYIKQPKTDLSTLHGIDLLKANNYFGGE